MEFQVNINNVILAQINQVESGEYNVTECRFNFSSEYEGLTKIAVFTGADGDAYKITILNNKCEIPNELLTESQIVQIGVYAYEVQGTEFILRYSPMPTRFMIEKGSYVVNAVNMSRPTPTEVEQLQSQITHNANNIEGIQSDIAGINQELVGINGELLGINRDIDDIKAEQIEQNTKIQKNTDDIVEINQNINEIDSHINAINENIDNLEQDLTNYSLITETGSQINLNVNSTNYKITAILKDKNGNVIYTSNAIDLPIESMIVNARYDNTTKEIVLTLQNGNTLRISVADLISGLVSETQLQTILANYYTKTEVDNLLSVKANQSSLDTTNQNLSNLDGRVSTNEEDIADIKEEQTTQNTNIEELQNQVETLQEDLDNANSEIEELNTDITNMAKAMYKVDGQGSDLTLENTSENKFVEFELSGRTEQESLSGKNLLDGANPTKNNSAIVSMTNNTIKVSSTAINTTPSVIYEIDNVQQGDTYRINAIIKNSNGQIVLQTKQDDTWTTYVILPYINGTSITSYAYVIGTNAEAIRYLLYADKSIPTGASESNYENVIVTKNNSDMTYEPYCGGIPSPNPDYPQQIKNVTGNANVKIQNKNLLPELWFTQNRKTISINGVTATINDDNTITLTGTATERTLMYFKPFNLKFGAGTYQYISNSNANLRIESTLITDGTIAYANSFNNTPYERTAQESFEITGSVLIIAQGQATNTTLYFFVQEENSNTSYVPHQEQNYPFTFAEGQRGMQGTKPKDDGIHNKHKQKIFDGTESFWFLTMAGDIPCFWFRNSDIGAKNNPHNKKCNYFIYSSLRFRSAEINTLCENESSLPLFIFKTNIANSVETWKQLLAQQYANGTPVIVEYELEEEEIIPYNETQQAQYNAMKEATSYDDITIISSESDELGFDMNVVAVADANKVIDNQNNEIDTIKSRLDLLEG